MTFEQAQKAFQKHHTFKTAAEYLRAARDAEAEGEIDDDDWLNALSDIQDYLDGLS